jgi:hypothetical protein
MYSVAKDGLYHRTHRVEVAVVGGGLAGMLAAIACARHGAKVVLMHDRPVLGGNCSSEIRMWALGCHGKNNRETGILEEILLENMYRNPTRNYSIWDSILYEKVKQENNITLLLNCSCNGAVMDNGHIRSISGWQLTTYTVHTVFADLFLDCSGDSILAPLSGALYRMGREAHDEYGEDIAPEKTDEKTMGMTCMLQARETDRPVPYLPPAWAKVYENDDDLPYRDHDLYCPTTNYWWMELGGEQNCIRDAEDIRDELLAVVFGVWDHIKNRGDHHAENWELEWVGFLPGKRESIRYIGDHVLTQNDVRAEGRFSDLVAYGGWTMDDHHPGGLNYPGKPNIFHPAPAPFGIPYRSLYSKNIGNLMFAGRNISTTHTAMSASRVMATCAVLGQAAGTAAAVAVKYGCPPRAVYESHMEELQQALMDDDCYLPWHRRNIPALTLNASLTSPGAVGLQNLRNGIDRPIGEEDNGCRVMLGETIQYEFDKIQQISRIRLVLDSDLERETCSGHPVLRTYPMLCNRFYHMEPFGFPRTMLRSFRLEYRDETGAWRLAAAITNNIQRLVVIPVECMTRAVRLVPEETWGDDTAHLFAFDVT